MKKHSFHQAEIFEALPKEARTTLLKSSKTKIINKGEYLVYQEDVWPYVLFLETGELRWVMLSTTGKEHELFKLEEGEVFWAHSLFDDEPMPASLIASCKSKILLWKRDEILDVLYNHPEVLFLITKKLTKIMRHAREIIYGLAFQPVASRLAGHLLQQCNETSGSIERDFTLNELSSQIAATPEVLCRLLYQFQDDGILEITRARINVNDFPALEKAAEL